VIGSIKQCYCADLLRTLANEDDSIIELWKRMMVLDVIYGVSQAWSPVNPVMLVLLWQKFLPHNS
jgi:hypothetical protein